MEFPLDGAGPRRLALAASLAIAALLAFQASEIWLANRRINSSDLDSIRRGAALTPADGEAWDRVGRFEEYDFADSSPADAIEAYRHAIADDPNSSYYWLDLGSAYDLAGNIEQARHAYGQARSAYPLSAIVAWNYGNFLLLHRQYDPAFEEIQRSVRADPSLLPLAISRVWRSSEDVNQLLDRALPPDTNAYFQAIDFFRSIQRTDAGLTVWNRLVKLNQPFPLVRAFPLLDELLDDNRADDARGVWKQALAAASWPNGDPPNRSVLYDGNFSHEFPNGGLGWRWDPVIGVSINFDTAPPAANGRSIRIEFGGGTNLNLDRPAQFAAVNPNTHYVFHADLKSEGITTESGIRFSITDPHDLAAVNITTDNLTGSHPWTSVNTDVLTGPSTHFVSVKVVRPLSRMFESKLAGTAWIANVSLIPADAAVKRASQ